MAYVDATIGPPGQGYNYTSLSSCESGEQVGHSDLVAAGDIARWTCYSMEDTAAVVIDGWTTGVSNYIEIRGADSDRTASNTGIWSTERYRLVIDNLGYTNALIRCYEDYVHFYNLQFLNSSSAEQGKSALMFDGFVYSKIGGNIFKAGTQTLKGYGIYINAYHSGVALYNNIFLGYNIGVVLAGADNVLTEKSYNSTFVSCATGLSSIAGSLKSIKNNLFTGCTTCTNGFTGSAAVDYNVTDGAALGYTVQSHDHVSHTFSFVNAGAGNYHLTSNDTGAIGFGVVDPGSGLFSDDIDGQTRPVSGTWDVGMDQYVATGGTTTWVNVAGVWKAVTTISINASGVWKTVSNVKVNVAGSWK